MRSRARVSESLIIGPFRFRLSAPLGKGQVWESASVKTGRRSRAGVSAPLGGKRGKR